MPEYIIKCHICGRKNDMRKYFDGFEIVEAYEICPHCWKRLNHHFTETAIDEFARNNREKLKKWLKEQIKLELCEAGCKQYVWISEHEKGCKDIKSCPFAYEKEPNPEWRSWWQENTKNRVDFVSGEKCEICGCNPYTCHC